MAKFNNLKCLVADDFSTARRLIKNSLQQMGFSCQEAENGNQAIALIQQTTLDLVIADVNMPEKNGLELLNQCIIKINSKL